MMPYKSVIIRLGAFLLLNVGNLFVTEKLKNYEIDTFTQVHQFPPNLS